jgi:hypothetical protein
MYAVHGWCFCSSVCLFFPQNFYSSSCQVFLTFALNLQNILSPHHLFVVRDEAVVDNEGLGRKSSKRCCIFHKQRPFGESSTDSSDYEEGGEGDDDGDQDGGGEGKKKPIARKKKGSAASQKKKTPDHLRFHA